MERESKTTEVANEKFIAHQKNSDSDDEDSMEICISKIFNNIQQINYQQVFRNQNGDNQINYHQVDDQLAHNFELESHNHAAPP